MEVAGLVVGGVALMSLFNTCVDEFKYIRVGLNYGGDFEKCLLQIAVARCRFVRWGQAISLNSEHPTNTIPTNNSHRPTVDDEKTLLCLLQNIMGGFENARRKSKKYEGKKTAMELQSRSSEDLQGTNKECYEALEKQASQRQKLSNVRTIIAWSLYKKEDFDSMISDLTNQIDSLEALFPSVEVRLRAAYTRDIECLQRSIIAALAEAAQNTDLQLLNLVNQKQNVYEKSKAAEIVLKDRAKFSNGDMVSDEWKDVTSLPKSSSLSLLGRVTAQDNTRVSNGNLYGTDVAKGFWDNGSPSESTGNVIPESQIAAGAGEKCYSVYGGVGRTVGKS